MKLFFNILLLLVLPFNSFSQKPKIIECDEFYKRISSTEDIAIFDIRVLGEYRQNRIKDALWAGTKDSLHSFLGDLKKETSIFLYCDIGKRSKDCSKLLVLLGYKKVFELKGGIKEWKKNGYPMDNSVIKD
ncbi:MULTISPECIES: rhodanese-like domain-containing protein [unclassified Saccharicrinis]|uniref:rhodanese-like domain-containing protein n=1 Tax=unclassified Saccharicrinis TaxID=2646859 RepID=UPI003D3392AA